MRPPAQKAKSPAPQAPAGASASKLGPKGVFTECVWVGFKWDIYLPSYTYTRGVSLNNNLFPLNYPCSPAATGFPVAKATGFYACGPTLQTDEGKTGVDVFLVIVCIFADIVSLKS